MTGKICVYIRDTQHPADLYDSSTHWYAISIHEVGSNGPLHWKGINYDFVWLPFRGEFNRVAGELEIPAGTYLIQGFAYCWNITTQVAWVQVNDGETISVNLIPTTVRLCINRALLGVKLGTAMVNNEEVPIAKIAPREVEGFEKAAAALAGKLPKAVGIQLVEVDELQNRLRKTPKEEGSGKKQRK